MSLRSLALSFLAVFLLMSCNKDKGYVPPEAEWPEWIFSHWVWEDESTQESAIQLVDDYLAKGIPVGAIIIDSPWETGYNTFEWDPALFPDPQGMIDYFHSKNVKVLIWITSAINTDMTEMYEFCRANDFFMKESATGEPAIIDWWKGPGSLIDWWNPAAMAWWKSRMDIVLDMGIDGWKTDGTDYYAVFAPYSPGKGKNMTRVEYSHAYYRLFHEYTRERLGKDRIIMSRPVDNYGFNFLSGDVVAFAPIDIPAASWVGDQDATFEGLVAALNNLYYSSEMGYLITGSDIGGYREDNTYPTSRSKELFIRWAQLGAFCPLMENGGGGEHRPWMFDDETNDIYRELVLLHHKLIPYLDYTARASFDVKKSVMQFVRKADYSYMLGSDIFITPIRRAGNNPIEIRFPQGKDTWIYIYDALKAFKGGTSTVMNFEIDEFPAFVKKGSEVEKTLLP
jgi:alpha-glucosidase (family GH31 glycosyl hydrolase)